MSIWLLRFRFRIRIRFRVRIRIRDLATYKKSNHIDMATYVVDLATWRNASGIRIRVRDLST